MIVVRYVNICKSSSYHDLQLENLLYPFVEEEKSAMLYETKDQNAVTTIQRIVWDLYGKSVKQALSKADDEHYAEIEERREEYCETCQTDKCESCVWSISNFDPSKEGYPVVRFYLPVPLVLVDW